MLTIKIAINGHTIVSSLKRLYGSGYEITRLQWLVRGFTPMFILVVAGKLLG